MRNILFSVVLIVLSSSAQANKLPSTFSCMGGIGVTVEQTKAIIGAQTFRFVKQEGNLRRYKDARAEEMFTYDVASRSMVVMKLEGENVVGMFPLTNCSRTN